LSADISKDATRLVILDINTEILVWDIDNQTFLRRWQTDVFDEKSIRVAMSENKQVIASSGKHFLQLFFVETGRHIESRRVEGFIDDTQITQLILNYQGNKVFIGLNDGSIVVIDIKNKLKSLFQIHTTTVNKLLLLNNEQDVLSGAYDGKVALWSITSGEVNWRNEQRFRITSLAFEPLSKQLFISDALDSQQVLKLNRPSQVTSLKYIARNRYFREALLINNGNKLLISSSKDQLSLWDTLTGVELKLANIRALNLGSTTLDLALTSHGDVYTISSDGVLEGWAKKLFE